ncbi:MAG TPA: hypothetical protein VKS78_13465 [Roseiarcus sp.]|nr:hypothetical protein [Roseiarcus sp.]
MFAIALSAFASAPIPPAVAQSSGGGGGSGGPPPSYQPPQTSATTTLSAASSAAALSQLGQARRLAARVNSESAALKAAVSHGSVDARIHAVSRASPAIEADLKALIRIGNTLITRYGG